MHILYIHQHFALPSGSTGTRSYEFARRWVKAGHKVTIICGHYDVGGLEVRSGLIQRQTIAGINVVIMGMKYSNKQSFLRRIISFSSFMLLSLYVGLRTKEVDVIYATSTPLTVGIPAIILKWSKHVPFVFEVRDQWPEIPIDLGIIRNRILIKILLWLERSIYKQSTSIVALSPGMADGVYSVLNGFEKIVAIIPNSSDTDVFNPDIDGSKIREEKDWQNKLVLFHAGAMGKTNGLDFVVDVAEKLKSYQDIHFVLVGDGSERNRLIKRVEESGLQNIEIITSVPKTILPKYFAACDMSMVIFAKFPVLEHNSANKFFDSLSAGKPVLLNYSGWQKNIVEENHAGFGCKQCDIDKFVEKVLYFNSNRDKLVEMGQNSRRIAEEMFNRDSLASQVLEVLKSAVEK